MNSCVGLVRAPSGHGTSLRQPKALTTPQAPREYNPHSCHHRAAGGAVRHPGSPGSETVNRSLSRADQIARSHLLCASAHCSCHMKLRAILGTVQRRWVKQGEGERLRKAAKPGASYSLPNRQVEERLIHRPIVSPTSFKISWLHPGEGSVGADAPDQLDRSPDRRDDYLSTRGCCLSRPDAIPMLDCVIVIVAGAAGVLLGAK
jgi:hypothetical protein